MPIRKRIATAAGPQTSPPVELVRVNTIADVQGRESQHFRGPIGLVVVAALAGVLAFALASPAMAKKGKAPASTRSASVLLASGGPATGGAAATCTGKTHVTGGGFAVSPSFAPPGTGLRSWTTTSNPAGVKTWNASGTVFTSPNASGTFTTFARCENNTLGRIALTASSSAPLAPGEFRTLDFQCPPNTHAISGGYAGDGPTDTTNANGWRLDILQSQRTATRDWSVSVFDRSTSPPATAGATVTGFVVCELDQKGLRVGQATVSAPLVQNARAAADPTCPKKQHAISGGFVISPLPGGAGSAVPVVSLDENQPSGNRSWHVGLHPWLTSSLPPGESLQATTYCKRDSVPKK
jgi:hypothetical protein